MKQRRPRKPATPARPIEVVPASDLTGTHVIEGIKGLSDEKLMEELAAAEQAESWFLTQVKALGEGDELRPLLEAAASHARVVREVVAIVVTLRAEKKKAEKDGKGKKGPAAYL